MLIIRNYKPSDYQNIADLYKRSELFGGQFDENRDSEESLARKSSEDPESILICELDGRILGTVSLIEDGRVAWLFRFAVIKDVHEQAVTQALSEKALEILRGRGHKQVLVYAPAGDKGFEERYASLGFEKGNEYTCYWKDIVE